MNHDFKRAAAALDLPPADPRVEAAVDGNAVWSALSTVIDPEIGLDIVTLGLVYEVECRENEARVVFTLTTPGCPLEAVIRGGIEQAVSGVAGVGLVQADLVWEPRWHPGMIQEGAW